MTDRASVHGAGQDMTPVEDEIRREIAARGPMSFARFMALALYAPGVGYYERTDRRIGRWGDFYTSVSVGPVLGFLLAAHGAEVSRDYRDVTWVEAGAHDGRLAGDILDAADRFFPAMRERLRYRILEPSAARREVQGRILAAWGDRLTWHTGWEEVPDIAEGIVSCNELLDAFPAHRLVWNASERRWQEAGVTVAGDRLAWCRLDLSPVLDTSPFAPWESVLPDGFVTEACPEAAAWWGRAARSLRRGVLVALDYGDEDTRLHPERPEGSLRAYRQHRLAGDLLAEAGEQDLTAHVDFGGLMRAGEAEGLRTDCLLPQGRWLGRIAIRVLEAGGAPAEWLQARARSLQTLLHPGHLGHALRVLVQGRDGPGQGPKTKDQRSETRDPRGEVMNPGWAMGSDLGRCGGVR